MERLLLLKDSELFVTFLGQLPSDNLKNFLVSYDKQTFGAQHFWTGFPCPHVNPGPEELTGKCLKTRWPWAHQLLTTFLFVH